MKNKIDKIQKETTIGAIIFFFYFTMKWFSHGVLGKNARNLKYIRTKNKGKYTRLADNKLKTKEFLSPRGIPFAENYATIKTHQELKKFSLDSIESDAFVIKPNMGSKGKGILVIKRKKGKYFSGGNEWSIEDLELHMLDILQGAFSIHGADTVVIEEMLVPGKEFAKYCRHGLADIRIIICNYVPVTAMVRMPTLSSDGKANLAQGGIGLGIDIATGNITSFFQNNQSYTFPFPREYQFLQGSKLPYWDHILLFSAQIQLYTNLGYLALDWVITKNGPRLLEINARGGLEIQNVNLVPIASRLNQIEKIKVASPEKGVELAKSLFHEDTMTSLGGKHILSLSQLASVNGQEIHLRVNINQLYTQVSSDLRKRFGDEFLVQLPKGGQLNIQAHSTLETEKNTIILGQNSLENCLINPKRVSHITPKPAKWSESIMALDETIGKIGKKISISRLLRPTNYFEELSAFLARPYEYNPHFSYRKYTQKRLQFFEKEIAEGEEFIQRGSLQNEPLLPLYQEKFQEIKDRLFFIEAYQNQDYTKMHEANKRLFGEFDTDNLALAKEVMLSDKKQTAKEKKTILGKILSIDEITAKIQEYLKINGIREVPIHVSTTTFSRMAISYKKEPQINISHTAKIHEKEMQGILDHEIGTHLKRYLAGEKEGLILLKNGTGYYMSDEEGFAIYNSLQSMPKEYEKNTMYLNYYILTQIDTLSFVESAGFIKSIFPHKSFSEIFAHTLRLKRGLTDTSLSGTVGTTYWKDKIYLDGYIRTLDWIENGGDTKKLYKGKIKLSDLAIFDTL